MSGGRHSTSLQNKHLNGYLLKEELILRDMLKVTFFFGINFNFRINYK